MNTANNCVKLKLPLTCIYVQYSVVNLEEVYTQFGLEV